MQALSVIEHVRLGLDSGELSPQPPLKDEIWDYEAYIRWAEVHADGSSSETQICVRRTTFQTVRYPFNRMLESIYHLDFAKLFLARACPNVVRLYHSDAEDQLTRPSATRALLSAPDRVKGVEELLGRHGEALSKWAPTLFLGQLSNLATLHFLCGQRLKGLCYALRCVQHNPASPKFYAIIAFGLLGPRPLASVRALKLRLWPKKLNIKSLKLHISASNNRGQGY